MRSSRAGLLLYTMRVKPGRIARSLLALALAAPLALAGRALLAQDARGDEEEDAPDEVPVDAGARRCPAPRVLVDGDGRCCLPGQRWVGGRCEGRVTSCPPGESLGADARCLRRVREDDGGVRARRGDAGAAGEAPEGMARVPGGVFLAGPLSIELGPFAIDRAEVSVGGYRQCVDAGVCVAPVDPLGQMRRPDRPVVNVTHAMAETYCGWAGGRLPTSAEWLLAARGFEPRRYPWGERVATCALARVAGCGDGAVASGQSPADTSEFGLTDVAGNVSEWVLDGPPPPRARGGLLRDPVGATEGGRRWVRGGSFLSTPEGAELRRSVAVDAREARIDRGFRCARGL